MNAGKDHDKAKRQAQANANRIGNPRYLHFWGGTYWVDVTDPVDAIGCVETFTPKFRPSGISSEVLNLRAGRLERA